MHNRKDSRAVETTRLPVLYHTVDGALPALGAGGRSTVQCMRRDWLHSKPGRSAP